MLNVMNSPLSSCKLIIFDLKVVSLYFTKSPINIVIYIRGWKYYVKTSECLLSERYSSNLCWGRACPCPAWDSLTIHTTVSYRTGFYWVTIIYLY